MKRKYRKSPKKRKVHGKKRARFTRVRRRTRKPHRVRRRKQIALSARELNVQARAFRALGLMRREGVSLSRAARQERIKPGTFRRYAGRALYRSGPGKPWKARSKDQLAASMTVLTSRGPVAVIVRNSRERKLLGQYDAVLRMFRAGEDGAEAALKAFERKTVGGHKLITDTKLLIQLEEAGQLDFDTLYTSFGAGS